MKATLKLQELKSISVRVVIEAEFDLQEYAVSEVEQAIDDALDTLRGQGVADVTSKKFLGELK